MNDFYLGLVEGRPDAGRSWSLSPHSHFLNESLPPAFHPIPLGISQVHTQPALHRPEQLRGKNFMTHRAQDLNTASTRVSSRPLNQITSICTLEYPHGKLAEHYLSKPSFSHL